ncbi:MAG TPA: helix-turn-helix domain-containing protein [Burkholderiales bacterium]|nr:helix-turn-helix domain-containing protein [Burkholderiales bacterium]
MLAQREKIKDFLIKHNQINTWEAIKQFGITRLGAHIYELRKRGMNIIGERKINEKTGTWYIEYHCQ